MRLALFDGRVVVGLATVFAVVWALGGDRVGAAAGCLAIGAGLMELRGVGRLKLGDPEGMRWLVRSQGAVFLVVLGYAVARIWTYDHALVMGQVMTPQMQRQLTEAGLQGADVDTFVRVVFVLTYVILVLVVGAYQGWLAWYFHRRRGAVRVALEEGETRATE